MDLRYVFVDEECARMLGHRPEDLVGKKIAEVIGEEAFQTILLRVNAVLAGSLRHGRQAPAGQASIRPSESALERAEATDTLRGSRDRRPGRLS
jgi:PAS domain-containing protein